MEPQSPRNYPPGWEFHDPNPGWYRPPRCNEFGAYMHNPWGYPTEIENKAITKHSKLYESKEEMANTVYNYIQNYFGDRNKNQKEGLVKQYIRLKDDVIDSKVIASIIWGADVNNIDREISKYTTTSNTEISLTANSICQHLIKEYIKPENVDDLCVMSM